MFGTLKRSFLRPSYDIPQFIDARSHDSESIQILEAPDIYSCTESLNHNDANVNNYSQPSMYTNKNRVYRDFDTIDWLQDNVANKVQGLNDKRNRDGVNPFIFLFKWFLSEFGGWIIPILVSVIMGIISCFIAITADWLSDVREGYCVGSWYLRKSDCCWMNTENTSYRDRCNLWQTWSDSLNIDPVSNASTYFFVNYLFYIAFSVVMALLSSVYVLNLAPYACGTGITEVRTILSGFVIRGYLGMRTVMIKIIALILSVASGLNLSDESAQIHISSAISNLAARLFPKFNKNEAKRREIIGAGAAAGLASAFNAPISGLLFALEEICYYFPSQTLLRTFVCSMVSVFVHVQLRSVTIGLNSRYVSHMDGDWGYMDFFPLIFISFACGCLGVLFNKILYKWSHLRKTSRFGSYPILEVFILALVTSLISFPIELSRSSNHSLFSRLMTRCRVYQDSSLCDYHSTSTDDIKVSVEKYAFIPGSGVFHSLWQLAIIFLTKIPLIALTASAKIPTGYFLPLIVVGACIGRFVGIATEIILIEYLSHIPRVTNCLVESSGCIDTNLYALVGASAFFSGVTRMTITSVFLLIEMTNGSYYITLIMLASTIANFTSAALSSGSIFQSQIKLNNYPFLDKLLSTVSQKPFKSIKHILKKLNSKGNRKINVLYERGMNLNEMRMIISKNFFGYPLLTKRGSKTFVGYVKRTSVVEELDKFSSYKLENDTENRVSFIKVQSAANSPYPTHVCDMSSLVDHDMVTIDLESSVDNLAYIFQNLGMRSVMVVNEGDFVDLITKKDFLEYLL